MQQLVGKLFLVTSGSEVLPTHFSPLASGLHCNSNLSYLAMDIFLSDRMFCIFTLEYISEMQGLFKALKMEHR